MAGQLRNEIPVPLGQSCPFCALLCLRFGNGLEETMKTPAEFDYDLWTAKDGKRMVRVKCTGEVCEVDEATFRFLRSEEKALRRSMKGIPIPGCKNGETFTVLSRFYQFKGSERGNGPCMVENIRRHRGNRHGTHCRFPGALRTNVGNKTA